MGEQQFRYVLTRGKRTVSTLFQQSAQWLQPPYVLYRSGTLASKPFLPITLIPSDSVQLETFKRAEDDNGWVIRLREISGEISAFQLMIGSYICQNTLKPYEIVSYLFKNGTFFAINGLEQNI
jgi:alpha-mannosidase